MKHIRWIWAAPVLAVLAAAPLPAAKRPPDPCGDPAKTGQPYLSYTGTVRQILDPVTLLVDVNKVPAGNQPFPGCPAKGCSAKVRLVNLDAPTDSGVANTAQTMLFKATRSRQLILALSSVQDASGITNVLLYDGTRSINQQQLTAGYATYRPFGPNAIDGYVECKLKRGEDQAKRAGRGVWVKPAGSESAGSKPKTNS